MGRVVFPQRSRLLWTGLWIAVGCTLAAAQSRWERMGLAADERGDFDGAVTYFARDAEESAENPNAWNNLGVSKLRRAGQAVSAGLSEAAEGDFREAAEHFRLAMDLEAQAENAPFDDTTARNLRDAVRSLELVFGVVPSDEDLERLSTFGLTIDGSLPAPSDSSYDARVGVPAPWEASFVKHEAPRAAVERVDREALYVREEIDVSFLDGDPSWQPGADEDLASSFCNIERRDSISREEFDAHFRWKQPLILRSQLPRSRWNLDRLRDFVREWGAAPLAVFAPIDRARTGGKVLSVVEFMRSFPRRNESASFQADDFLNQFNTMFFDEFPSARDEFPVPSIVPRLFAEPPADYAGTPAYAQALLGPARGLWADVAARASAEATKAADDDSFAFSSLLYQQQQQQQQQQQEQQQGEGGASKPAVETRAATLDGEEDAPADGIPRGTFGGKVAGGGGATGPAPQAVSDGTLVDGIDADPFQEPTFADEDEREAGLGYSDENPCVAYTLGLGPSGSGLPFHFHEDLVGNMNLFGRKRWFLSRKSPPLGYSGRMASHEYLRTIRSRMEPSHLEGPDRLYDCTTEPGDIVYVPGGWYHQTMNVGHSLNVAFRCRWADRLENRRIKRDAHYLLHNFEYLRIPHRGDLGPINETALPMWRRAVALFPREPTLRLMLGMSLVAEVQWTLREARHRVVAELDKSRAKLLPKLRRSEYTSVGQRTGSDMLAVPDRLLEFFNNEDQVALLEISFVPANDSVVAPGSLAEGPRRDASAALLNEALAHLRVSVEENPLNPEAHAAIAAIHALRGEVREGILAARRAMELDRHDSTSCNRLARLYLANRPSLPEHAQATLLECMRREAEVLDRRPSDEFVAFARQDAEETLRLLRVFRAPSYDVLVEGFREAASTIRLQRRRLEAMMERGLL